ncbi:PHB depolymerase family esterase [Massilia sp. TS11]|uniref:extracellular catalytic domain type 1 short-chain-length polyhydroxyalkanoate depolymerase n=1 Tax=Massilia sp. TS11 TaxID=2908003 RepID=UPI001EDA26C4|nr:PHB depolymerase family esterase [Massilia sp. TS11]MCG2586109.1 PHB depolymerase family esterase [Massilia sp. TS11]
MKPFENFIEQMHVAAQRARQNDPLGASELVQQALNASGLLPELHRRAPRGRAATPRADKPMVDLNAVPDWVSKVQTGPFSRAGKAAGPDPRAPGEFLESRFTAEQGTRRYKLYVPSKAPAGPRPLIVMLHGCTQNPDDFAAGTAMNVLAETHACFVLYPEQSRSANATQCWNWFEAEHQQRGAGEPALLAALTRQIVQTRPIDPQRIYVAGLSAGGAMAAILGLAYPELYAAVGVHSGLAAGSARDLITGLAAMKKAPAKARAGGKTVRRPSRPVPVIVFHGDRDEVVHLHNGGAVLQQFLDCTPDAALQRRQQRVQQPDGRGYTQTALLTSGGRSVAEFWELHGAGHAWSGGNPAGTFTDPAGPDASAEMLRFFFSQSNGASSRQT